VSSENMGDLSRSYIMDGFRQADVMWLTCLRYFINLRAGSFHEDVSEPAQSEPPTKAVGGHEIGYH